MPKLVDKMTCRSKLYWGLPKHQLLKRNTTYLRTAPELFVFEFNPSQVMGLRAAPAPALKFRFEKLHILHSSNILDSELHTQPQTTRNACITLGAVHDCQLQCLGQRRVSSSSLGGRWSWFEAWGFGCVRRGGCSH